MHDFNLDCFQTEQQIFLCLIDYLHFKQYSYSNILHYICSLHSNYKFILDHSKKSTLNCHLILFSQASKIKLILKPLKNNDN